MKGLHSGQTKDRRETKKDPKLRHEFVGMMFAVTIAEVGLQVAAVVQRGHWTHYLPAYSHLILATMVVGASWVGWSLSPSPGARQDVVHVLHVGFLVLLTDVFLVVVYFILVRSVDFSRDLPSPYVAPVPKVASWIVIMFVTYLFWDFITKWPFFYKTKFDKAWFRDSGTRILATCVCLGLAVVAKWQLRNPDKVHYIAADVALLCIILLFRAFKDICSAFFPTKEVSASELVTRKRKALWWTLAFFVGMTVSIFWARSSNPLPGGIARSIQDESIDVVPRTETHPPASALEPVWPPD